MLSKAGYGPNTGQSRQIFRAATEPQRRNGHGTEAISLDRQSIVTSQVWDDQPKALDKKRYHKAPASCAVGEAMQEHNWRIFRVADLTARCCQS